MKTIIAEDKAKFYNQYQFTHSCFEGISNSIWHINHSLALGYYVVNGDFGKIYMNEASPLLLKSLSNVTDAEIIELFNMMFNKDHSDKSDSFKIGIGKSWVDSYNRNAEMFVPFNYIKGYQYLQSKGYALRYMDYSVDDLVENKTIKLINP
jgi:hypothetical protein